MAEGMTATDVRLELQKLLHDYRMKRLDRERVETQARLLELVLLSLQLEQCRKS